MDYDTSKVKSLLTTNNILVSTVKLTIFVISIYFICLIFYKNFQQIKLLTLSNKYTIIEFVLLSSIIYGFILLILAMAWKKILELIENRKLNNQVVLIYLNSQLYKYLPGNIFHYANRHIAANKISIQHKTLLKSNVIEAMGLVLSALVFSVFILSLWKINLKVYFSITVFLLLLFFYLRKLSSVQIMFKVTPYYLMYFITIGLLCFYVVNYLTQNQLSIILCISLYSISWVAGYIIPGAPGGIGVRESVFVILSHNLINSADAIFIITVLRLSTTLGEIISFIFSKISHRYYQNDTSNL